MIHTSPSTTKTIRKEARFSLINGKTYYYYPIRWFLLGTISSSVAALSLYLICNFKSNYPYFIYSGDHIFIDSDLFLCTTAFLNNHIYIFPSFYGYERCKVSLLFRNISIFLLFSGFLLKIGTGITTPGGALFSISSVITIFDTIHNFVIPSFGQNRSIGNINKIISVLNISVFHEVNRIPISIALINLPFLSSLFKRYVKNERERFIDFIYRKLPLSLPSKPCKKETETTQLSSLRWIGFFAWVFGMAINCTNKYSKINIPFASFGHKGTYLEENISYLSNYLPYNSVNIALLAYTIFSICISIILIIGSSVWKEKKEVVTKSFMFFNKKSPIFGIGGSSKSNTFVEFNESDASSTVQLSSKRYNENNHLLS